MLGEKKHSNIITNLTQNLLHKHSINEIQITKHKNTKKSKSRLIMIPGLVVYYDIRPGKGAGLFSI